MSRSDLLSKPLAGRLTVGVAVQPIALLLHVVVERV